MNKAEQLLSQVGETDSAFKEFVKASSLIDGKQDLEDLEPEKMKGNKKAPDSYRLSKAKFGGLTIAGKILEDMIGSDAKGDKEDDPEDTMKEFKDALDISNDLADDMEKGYAHFTAAMSLPEELDTDDPANNYEEDDDTIKDPSAMIQSGTVTETKVGVPGTSDGSPLIKKKHSVPNSNNYRDVEDLFKDSKDNFPSVM